MTSVDTFISDPGTFFEESYTGMHSLARDTLVDLQRSGLTQRFQEMVERIPMVEKLASRQGISDVSDFPEVVPLLFEHTMYKSYPVSLLERQQFGRLTGWLDKLTSEDLTDLDTGGCDSIQAWIGRIRQQSPLELLYSSGTSGTMSFLPWAEPEHLKRARLHRISQLQPFGEPPSEMSLSEPIHRVSHPPRNPRDYEGEAISLGEPGYNHLRATGRQDADLLWLAARLRLAAFRGDASRVAVPASLLARRDELERLQANAADADRLWIEEIEHLQGQRVLWNGYPFELVSIAGPRLEAGKKWSFLEGSVLQAVGGSKGNPLPPDWIHTLRRFTDARFVQGYGMVELSNLNFRCSAERYHLQPWIIPYVLDPETSQALPREGAQTGRFAAFDLLPSSHWGGLITGDEVEVDFDEPCPCGRTTQHVSARINRLSDVRGGDDKITCAATPEAYAEAMEFLTSL